ncbi:MAG: lamin tail domain-containing protein [Pirellulales bacterium]|nr:lamin tail domain-containing protein [Pirellulales bacterium]
MLRTLRDRIAIASGRLRRGAPRRGGNDSNRFHRMSFETLEDRRVLDCTAVFNEIMYNPAGDTDDTLEWIELYNQMAVDMDLEGWSIEGGIDFTFPDRTYIPGHGFLVVAASPAALQAETGYAGALGPFTGRLSNSGEELRLVNIDGRQMNVLDYGDEGDWPVGPDGSGVTLAKIDPDTATAPAENWGFSADINGTPGAPNVLSSDSGSGGGLVESTLIPAGATWSYLDDGSNQGTAWYAPGFNDAGWESGRAQLGYGDGDEVTVIDSGPSSDKYITSYFRHSFQVSGADGVIQLDLGLLRDDGAVVHLNGQEVGRSNMPEGEIGYLTTAGPDTGSETTFYPLSADPALLVDGENVLAVEVHQRSHTSTDVSFDLFLNATRPETPPPVLRINEVAPADSGDFWVEILNTGGEDMQLGGFVLAGTGLTGGEHVLASRTLSPGEMLLLSQAQLGFRPEADERLFLYAPGKTQLVDAREVTNRLRGRSPDHGGQWLYPSAPTPGSENTFDFHDEIVINEIMYHAYPQLATDSQPFEESNEEWIELYNRGATTVDLGGWKFEDAVEYEFEPGTSLAPGEYLVVARDAGALRAKHPTIEIVGEFSGTLSNNNDRILLIDDAKNPADEVHYYEGGRWPLYADGGGSTLELRDPDADNSQAEAWAASNERDKSTWTTYTYDKVSREPMGISALYNEFICGLLDSGEILIDDVSVIRNPGGSGVEMMQNGSFEGDAIGTSPSHWRIIGNHSGIVDTDPLDDTNKVLHLTADGPQWFVHDHAETTFVGNTPISDGTEYRISFRAKWVAGNSQLNTRLYFTRAGSTTNISVPPKLGTPGAQNSTYVANVGPTYSDFGHTPVLPSAGQPVTVSVRAEDPDGLAAVNPMILRWTINGTSPASAVMTHQGNGLYTGTIPGQSSGTIIQFFVQGTDTRDGVSTYPAGGFESRALYQVANEASRPIDTVRIVMLASDYNRLFAGSTSRMSNQFVGATLIHTWANGQEAFYNASVRQTGSRFTRPSGFKVSLGPDQLFRGVHDSIRLDWTNSEEILMKHMISSAGGTVSLYDDFGYLVSQRHTGLVLLQLARFSDQYLDEAYENGGDGTLYEMDDITYPTNPQPSPEGLKTDTGYISSDIFNRGDSEEDYRGHYLIKNNRARDDFSQLVQMSQAFSLSGTALDEATQAVMDLDVWMRHYAIQSFLGNWDTYGFSRHKNLRLYVRPEDNKVIPLPWDQDLANYTENLIYNGSNLSRIRDLPANLRRFYGNMWDLMDRSFNGDYMQRWSDHYSQLAGVNYGGELNAIRNRVNSARSHILSAIPQTSFRVTTNGGNNFSVHDVVVTIEGQGWIDVRQVRLAGSEEPLDVSWTDRTTWQVSFPIAPGPNALTFEAIDYEGEIAATDSITVTSTVPNRPLQEHLRIAELNYNPADPAPEEGAFNNDDFEFVELLNTGDQTLDLNGVRFADGIEIELTGSYQGPPVLITEAGTADDFVEIQNISGQTIDTSGWVVAVNLPQGTSPVINNRNTILWALPDAMAPDEILYRHDDPDEPSHYWGEGIAWQTSGNGWVMIVDNVGQVVDFLAWGYLAADIAAMTVDINGHQVTVTDVWQGDGAARAAAPSVSLQRSGEGDHDDASDFAFVGPITEGEPNAALTVPFAAGPIELEPGEYLVIAANLSAFRARYGTGVHAVGPYTGSLRNSGEHLLLLDGAGGVIADFEYGDSDAPNWPDRADGKGSSLELIDPAAVPQNGLERITYLNDGNNWRSSNEFNGSPGTGGTGLVVDVVVNEVLSHTDPPLTDAIELHNTTDAPVDVGGWYLSDSWGFGGSDDYRKFRIPDDTVIPAGGYVVFDEDDFNPTPWTPLPNHFALNGAHGDDVWLMEADPNGGLLRFADHVEFMAAANGESFGRWPNGSGELVPMISRTLDPGRENSAPRVGPVIISEVQYNPGAMVNADDLEYIEIYNPTGIPVDLTNWRIRQGVDFDFAPGTTLASGAALVVVPFNPADTAKLSAFRDHYGISTSVQIVGGYADVLDNGGETVQLQRPDLPPVDEPDFIPRLLEDEVRYDDDLPWPVEADGGGLSLNRLTTTAWGNESRSWDTAVPTPGSASPESTATVVGRHVFYNASVFDGNNAAANSLDDSAIAADKTALLPGGTASFANYTSYSRGINGLMIDVAGLPDGAVLSANDFQFRTGNSNTPASWGAAAAPIAVTVRPGAGDAGSDRVTLIWPDFTISRAWLQVTVLPTPQTGLVSADVFYFGNAIGEAGDSVADAKVNATDMLLARNNPRNFLNPAPIDFVFDFNRDARVNATDMLLARNNQTHFLNALRLIVVPAAKTAEEKEAAVSADKVVGSENLAADAAWLYEIAALDTQRQPSGEKIGAEAAADMLLADDAY